MSGVRLVQRSRTSARGSSAQFLRLKIAVEWDASLRYMEEPPNLVDGERAEVAAAFGGALELCCGNLERARAVVGDAIATLMTSCLVFRETVAHQQTLLRSITDHATAERVEAIVQHAEEVKRLAHASSELSAQIRGEASECHDSVAGVNATLRETLVTMGAMLDDAVRALQFEDLVTQLLTDTTSRLRELGALTHELFAAGSLTPERAVALCADLQNLTRTASVSQASVDRGSIELF